MPKNRRAYREGRCGDCGRTVPVTRIKFWLNGPETLVCAACRNRILRSVGVSKRGARALIEEAWTRGSAGPLIVVKCK